MTSLKHNFSIMNNTDNPFLGMFFEVNNAGDGLLGFLIIGLILFVSFYSINRTYQDLTKSGLLSLHIVFLISLPLFYLGKLSGYTIINELLFLSIIVVEVIGLAVAYFLRIKQNG